MSTRQFTSNLLPPPINDFEKGHWHWRTVTQKYAQDLAVETTGLGLQVEAGPIALTVVVANRSDWDSRLKGLCDGLQAIGVVLDDAQIVEAHVLKCAKGEMDHAVLVRWRPTEETKTAAIEALWGSPVKSPSPRDVRASERQIKAKAKQDAKEARALAKTAAKQAKGGGA